MSWNNLDRFETPPTPPKIEIVAHVAKSAYADWEMRVYHLEL
jgi:hypothetical protein